jgi:hypothetical protein
LSLPRISPDNLQYPASSTTGSQKSIAIAPGHYQCTKKDPFIKGSQVLVATDNTSVVSSVYRQRGTHSHSLLTLTQERLLWLHTPDYTPDTAYPWWVQRDSGPHITQPPGTTLRLTTPSHGVISSVQSMGNSASGHVCHSSPQHSPSYHRFQILGL